MLKFLGVALLVLAEEASPADIVQICLCHDPPTPEQQWSIPTLGAISFVRTNTNSSQCDLAIAAGYFPDEGSGAIMEADHFSDPRVPEPYQQWTVNTETKQVVWAHNFSLCLTILPPEPAPAALVGIWPCGLPGFETAQEFEAIVTGAAPVYQLKNGGDADLCVSLPGSC